MIWNKESQPASILIIDSDYYLTVSRHNFPFVFHLSVMIIGRLDHPGYGANQVFMYSLLLVQRTNLEICMLEFEEDTGTL